MRSGAPFAAAMVGLCVLSAVVAHGERPQRLERLAQQAARARGRLERIPASHRGRLSAGAQNYMHRAQQWSQVEAKLRALGGPGAPAAPRLSVAGRRMAAPSPGPAMSSSLTGGRVSDPWADAATSFLAGFTQSETSTAWCGNVAVVAFNDSGSLLPSLAAGGGGSFNGYSRSTDEGATFKDLGFLPISNPDAELLGDPVAACTDARTFYYASLHLDFGSSTTGASVSKSTDGGVTFGDPVAAVAKSLDSHFIDKEWMAADPTNSQRLYVTYTDFDFSGDTCGTDGNGDPIFRTGIELVKSIDGGGTWSPPLDLATSCGDDGEQGSQVVVDDHGRVFVAWEHFPAGVPYNEIRLRKSTNQGASFSSPVLVSQTIPVGGNGGRQFLQGIIRVVEFPSLAVDRSRGPQKGNLYVSWNDGRFASIPDGLAADGVYAFSDVLFVRSTDGGASFDAAPTRIHQGSSTTFTDQYMPALGVDKEGTLGICYYDRRRDDTNFFIDRRCARSDDGGHHWEGTRVNHTSFPSTQFQDFAIAFGYQGDYDTLTGDFLKRSSGLLGAYADNTLGSQDVKSNRLSGDSDDGHDDLDDHRERR